MARIAFVSTMGGYPWGGSEELWSQTAVALVRRGHQVFASVQRWEDEREQVKWMARQGVKLSQRPGRTFHRAFRAFARTFGMGDGRVLREAERILWIGWGRESWLARTRPELVCISNGDTISGAQWMASCKRRRIPYVTLAQANYEYWWPEEVEGAELRELMNSAERCFFVSENNLRLFEDQLGAKLSNAETAWNPYRTCEEGPLPWPSTPPEGPYRLACVGRLFPAAKGQDLVLRVLSLPQWRERRLTVSFFGDDRYATWLMRQAQVLGIEDRVELRGHTLPAEIWSEHHALFLPSRYEGLPTVLVEAMLCGRPAIVTAVAGNPDIVVEGESGFLAAAPTVPLVAEAMERAWSQRSRWEKMGTLAACRIREMMPADPAALFADRLEQLLREPAAIADRRTSPLAPPVHRTAADGSAHAGPSLR